MGNRKVGPRPAPRLPLRPSCRIYTAAADAEYAVVSDRACDHAAVVYGVRDGVVCVCGIEDGGAMRKDQVKATGPRPPSSSTGPYIQPATTPRSLMSNAIAKSESTGISTTLPPITAQGVDSPHVPAISPRLFTA